jgi:hypothetical protein
MASHSLRFWLAAVIFLLALVFLIVSFWPEVRTQQVVPMPPVVLPSATPVLPAPPAALYIPGVSLGEGL